MPGVALVATLAVVAILASGCEAAVTPARCAPPSVAAAGTSGQSRCVRLPERVRIRLAVERGVATRLLARRHRLTRAAVREIASQPGSRILPRGGGAMGLGAEPGCAIADGRAKARLTWQPAQRGRQVVIVAPEHVGLATGRFWASRLLSSGRSRTTWRRFAGQAVHLWAVLTRTREGWTASEQHSFTGPLCPIDYQQPDARAPEADRRRGGT